MSNLQNVLANVIRPVYTYDPTTSNYVAKVVISNVDTFSVRTIEVENLEFGDANRNLYLGVDAGSVNSNSASNVAIGYGAAENNINTKNSVFVGYTAGGADMTDVSSTVAIGANTRAGGYSNVYVGYGTGSESNASTGNVFLGSGIAPVGAVSNQLRIGVGSSIPISADIAAGNVGINTTAPQYALDVVGSTTNLRGALRVAGVSGGTLDVSQISGIEIGNGDDATGSTSKSTMSLQWGGGGFRHLIRTRHQNVSNSVGNAIDMFVNNSTTQTGSSSPGSGNILALSATAAGVGIGMSNPAYALDVSGILRASGLITTGGSTTLGDVVLANGTVALSNGTTAIPALTFQSDLSLGLFRGGANILNVVSAGSNRMTISNASVGIGTTTPAYTLDVSGGLRASGLIASGGSVTAGGTVLTDGSARLTDGSASVPTLTFQNDLSLGLFRSASNVLNVASAGSNRMTISNDNVGIGTTTPAYTLDVSGVVRATQFIGTSGSGTSGGVSFSNGAVGLADGTVSVPTLTFQNDLSLGLYRSGSNVLRFASAGSNRMTISNGNVGIGTTTPGEMLDVYGDAIIGGSSSSNLLRFRGTTGDSDSNHTVIGERIYGGAEKAELVLFKGNDADSGAGPDRIRLRATEHRFQTYTGVEFWNTLQDNNDRMVITNNGNVGIGTAAPGFTLDVNGTTRSSNEIVGGYLRNALIPTQFDISGGNISNSGTHTSSNFIGTSTASNQIGGVTLSNSNVSTTNAIVGGYLRNALIPTQFDISGGNISNSGTHTSSNFIGTSTASNQIGGVTLSNSNVSTTNAIVSGYLRNALIPTQFDISGGNISNSNSIQTGDPQNKSLLGTIEFGKGYTDGGASGTPALSLQFSGGGYRHFVRSRHNAANDSGNAIDFFVNTSAVSTASTVPNTGNALGLSVSSVGISNLTATSNTIGGVTLSNTRLGVGTAAPTTIVDIRDVSATVRVCDTTNRQPTIELNRNNGGAFGTSAIGDWRIQATASGGNYQLVRGSTANTIIPFHVDGVAGNVGIGTTTPAYALDVSGTTQSSNAIVGGYLRNALTPTQFDISGGNIMQTGSLILNSTDTPKIYFVTSPSIGLNGPRLTHTSGWTLNFFAGWTSNNNEGNFTFNRSSTTSADGFQESLRITNAGNVGIGTAAPARRLDVSGTAQVVQKNVSFLVSDTSSGFVEMYTAFDTYGIIRANGPLDIFSAGSARGSLPATSKNRLSADNGASWLTGSSVGIGTSAPAYALDVSAASTTASVNMSTWPRMSQSNVMIVRGIAGSIGNTVNWSNTQQNTINTNLATIVLSNGNGSSFKILKSGIWSFQWTIGVNNGFQTWMDVSTNDNSNVAAYAAGNPIIAHHTTGAGNFGQASWTGYLPSNANNFYKIRSGSGFGTGNSYYLQIMFLFETPNAGGNFPFP